MKRRSILPLLTALVVATAFTSGATAQSFPEREIKIISMHPAGSVTDVLARPIAEQMEQSLKQPVIVENHPGANGVLATQMVWSAPANGHTILVTSGSHIANAHTGQPLPFDPIEDFEPITQISASYGLALITSLPVNSVEELVELGKTRNLTYAINGTGNVTHIAGLLLERMSGLKLIAVPYNTTTLATDVIAGTVDFAFFAVSLSAPLVEGGQVKALAVTGDRRTPALPEVPTMQEQGYADFNVTGYFGFLAPKGTPKEAIDVLHREITAALKAQSVEESISRGGQYVVGSTPEEFRQLLVDDNVYQDKLMTDLGLK